MISVISNVGLWPIIVAAVLSFLFGWAWYSPFLFGKRWAGWMKKSEKQLKAACTPFTMVYGVLFALVKVLGVAVVYSFVKPVGLSELLTMVTVLWLGFIVPTQACGVLWEFRDRRVVILYAVMELLSLLIIASVMQYMV